MSDAEDAVEAWNTAIDALMDGGKIIGVSYGDLQDGLKWGECWDLYLENGGMVELGAVPARDPEQPFERGVQLRATFYPEATMEPEPDE